VALKGVEAPLTVYDVTAVRGAHATALPATIDRSRLRFEPPLPITCYRVEGKRVADAGRNARLCAVSTTTAEISGAGELAMRETVRLVVDGMDAYAKVLTQSVDGDVIVAFTDVSPGLRRWLVDKIP